MGGGRNGTMCPINAAQGSAPAPSALGASSSASQSMDASSLAAPGCHMVGACGGKNLAQEVGGVPRAAPQRAAWPPLSRPSPRLWRAGWTGRASHSRVCALRCSRLAASWTDVSTEVYFNARPGDACRLRPAGPSHRALTALPHAWPALGGGGGPRTGRAPPHCGLRRPPQANLAISEAHQRLCPVPDWVGMPGARGDDDGQGTVGCGCCGEGAPGQSMGSSSQCNDGTVWGGGHVPPDELWSLPLSCSRRAQQRALHAWALRAGCLLSACSVPAALPRACWVVCIRQSDRGAAATRGLTPDGPRGQGQVGSPPRRRSSQGRLGRRCSVPRAPRRLCRWAAAAAAAGTGRGH